MSSYSTVHHQLQTNFALNRLNSKTELAGEQQRLIAVQQAALAQAERDKESLEEQLQNERARAQRALAEAQGLVKEWQSAMEAWRDLAQTLRDEIKACPNHEAHAFGKDDVARNKLRNESEDKARVKRGLKPVFDT